MLPWRRARLGSLRIGLGTKYGVCFVVFFITSCSSVMVFGGFLARLEEHGPGLILLTTARITASSVMSGVLALSWTNLR